MLQIKEKITMYDSLMVKGGHNILRETLAVILYCLLFLALPALGANEQPASASANSIQTKDTLNKPQLPRSRTGAPCFYRQTC
ncbi:MAG: hypothetical protein R8M11_02670, partial [Gallionella sp.]